MDDSYSQHLQSDRYGPLSDHLRLRPLPVTGAHINGPDRILQKDDRVPGLQAVLHGAQHAVVGSQAADEETPYALRAQACIQLRPVKCGIGVLLRLRTLEGDKDTGNGEFEGRGKCRAF